MRALDNYRSRPHWSFSSLNLFLSMCTLQWAFRYVYKVEPEHTSVNLVFGSAFHRSAEYLAGSRMHGCPASTAEIQECFSDHWSDACHSDESIRFEEGEEEELAVKGREMIACLQKNWNPNEEVISISKAFCVPILDANGDLVTDKPLIGEIDCIVTDDSGETLIDWKTAARKWPEVKAGDDLQATAFTYGYRKPGGPFPSFRYDVVTKTKTPAYQQCQTSRSQEDLHRFAELVRVVERAVEAEAFWPNHTCFACSGCQFKSACREWHRNRARTISQPALAMEAA